MRTNLSRQRDCAHTLYAVVLFTVIRIAGRRRDRLAMAGFSVGVIDSASAILSINIELNNLTTSCLCSGLATPAHFLYYAGPQCHRSLIAIRHPAKRIYLSERAC